MFDHTCSLFVARVNVIGTTITVYYNLSVIYSKIIGFDIKRGTEMYSAGSDRPLSDPLRHQVIRLNVRFHNGYKSDLAT